MIRSSLIACGVLAAMAACVAAMACPFCTVSQTLTEEMKAAEVAVIAKLVGDLKRPRTEASDDNPLNVLTEVPKTRFEVVEVLKGAETLGEARTIDILYFGEMPKGTPFLIQGNKIPELAWGTPLPLSDRAVEYVRRLPSLPEKGTERLAFFEQYLEDEDPMLATDAYDEFAVAPYEEIKAAKHVLDHEELIGWLKDPEISTIHRRQYLTLLGVVARDHPRAEDIALLEDAITREEDVPKPALDATIACYLTLKGPEGMPLIEEEFFRNKEAEYSETYAAIMALRFHGQEEKIIPKELALSALRCLLDRPELADLIIPDLARWQDWSAMDRLVTLFKDADGKTSWVRVPVIQFLRACPLPEAKEHIDELAKIDPEAVKRANFFVPLGLAKPAPVPAADAAAPATENAPAGAAAKDEDKAPETTTKKTPTAAPADSAGLTTLRPVKWEQPDEPLWVVFVPLGVGLGLLAMLALVLRGRGKLSVSRVNHER